MNNYFDDEYYYNGEKITDRRIIDCLKNGCSNDVILSDNVRAYLKSNANKKFKYNIGDTVVIMNDGLLRTYTIIGRRKNIESSIETIKNSGITIGQIRTFQENMKYFLETNWSIRDILLVDEKYIIGHSEVKPIKVVYENDTNLIEYNPNKKLDIKPFTMSIWDNLDKPPRTFTVNDCSFEFTIDDHYNLKELRKRIEKKPEHTDEECKFIERFINKIDIKKVGTNIMKNITYCEPLSYTRGFIVNTPNEAKIICDALIDNMKNGEIKINIEDDKSRVISTEKDMMTAWVASNTNHTMPNITDYTYDPDTATTTITWSDNTTTTVTAEDKATADQYTGFMTAYAKKAAGNTSRIQSIYERALKLPKKKALAEQKAKEQEEEQRKIRENQKARKRRQRVRREARRRKEQYEKTLLMDEAKRLAEKEYGVPYEQSDWLKQSGDGANGKTET